MRSKVASMTFEELGWRKDWGEEGLETLLRRLSSFEGRQLHLMIGTNPFLSCHFCSSPKDYMLFSISDRLWQFSANLILFGLLTCRFDSLEVFDEVVYSLLQMVTGRNLRSTHTQKVSRAETPAMILRPHGYGYRAPLLYLMGAFALADAVVYLGFVDVSFGQGRWDHWHANSNIAFHSTLLASAFWIYFGQRIPKVPAMLEIAHLMKLSRMHTEQTLSHIHALHLTNRIMWSDVGMRQKVSDWYDARTGAFGDLNTNEATDNLYSRAEKSGVDASSLRKSSQMAATGVWKGIELGGLAWERTLSQPASTVSESSTSLPSSLNRPN